ncbi:MAG: ion transporter [Desulfurobacteriaceae bacterium]
MLKESFSKKILTRLKKVKIWLYNLLESDTGPYRLLYDTFALFIVVTSSVPIVLELWIDIPLPPDLQRLFDDYEEISLLFFVVEYILRFWVISDFIDDFREGLSNTGSYIKAFFIALEPKLKWMVKPYSIIDLLAILPIFRPFRTLRILRLLRLLKIFRYTYALRSLFLAIKEEAPIISFIVITLVLWIVTISLTVYIYEYNAGNKAFHSVFEAIYWGIVTISTVGYGDITPVTKEGKFLASLLISGGIVLVSALTATFSATLINRMNILKGEGLKMDKLKNHLVICGWSESGEELVEEIIRTGLDKEKPVVLVTELEKSELGVDISKYILYKKGDFTKEQILVEVSIQNASEVVILGERKEGLSDRNVDARTALTAMLVKTMNPKAKIYVEVLHDENAEVFEKRLGVNGVFMYGKVIGRLMFNSIVTPGSAKLMEKLLTNEGTIKKVKIKEVGNFETFGELIRYLRRYKALPIAIERKEEVILNPPDEEKLEDGDNVFVVF